MPQSVDALLNDIRLLGEEQYRIVQAVRALAKKTETPSTEQVKYGGILFTSGVPFGGVFAYKEHVSLEFSHGARIADEHGYLEGKGVGRRHIKLRSLEDVAGKRVGEYLSLGRGAASGDRVGVLMRVYDAGHRPSEAAMRTTIAIDDDVLAAAKRLAEREQRTVGEVISSLARQGLARSGRGARAERHGIPLLPSGKNALPITMELVNQLRDEQP